MSMYTPGPWEARHELDSSDRSYVVMAGTVEVCRIGDYCEQPCDAHNARLIAAAHDLLEALRACAAYFRDQDLDENDAACFLAALAAIAKATGAQR
jgi:hypothetical protein